MAKGVKHYKKDGTVYTGGTHRMQDGSLHSGSRHSSSSTRLYHFGQLSKAAQRKARDSWR